MQLINIKDPTEQVSFRQAVLRGLGRGQGLYFPKLFEELEDVPGLLRQPFVPRSVAVLQHLVGEEIGADAVARMKAGIAAAVYAASSGIDNSPVAS